MPAPARQASVTVPRSPGGGGTLAGPVGAAARRAASFPSRVAERGLAVRHRASGFSGTVTRVGSGRVEIAGATGLTRSFPLEPGAFAVDGEAVTLVTGPRPRPPAPAPTPSGSRAAPTRRARVARASRILVEGVHDAELLERVWGDDLRAAAVVVERLDGLEHLDAYVGAFAPGRDRRLGVLVDHLVAGSKEQRLTARYTDHPHVLVAGHPFVDVWAGVRPRVLGIDAWPEVPPGRPWKEGVGAALGVGAPGPFWRDVLGRVSSYADLETSLVGAVERLLDFVTEPSLGFVTEPSLGFVTEPHANDPGA